MNNTVKCSLKKRIFAILLGLILLVVIAGSWFYIIENIHHDCVGDSCPICQHIREAEALLQQVNAAVIICIIVSVYIYFIRNFILNYTILVRNSLFSLQVRLNN